MATDESRRKFIVYCLEAIASVPLGMFGCQAILNRFRYYGVDEKALFQLGIAKQDLQPVVSAAKNAKENAATLYDAYFAAYRKTRIVPYTTTDSKGRTSLHFRTEHYWDVPSGMPQPNEVESLKEPFEDLEQKLLGLHSQRIVDWSRTDCLQVEVREASTWKTALAGCGGYGLAIAALVFYEEALNKAVGFDYERNMPRRSLFKILAVGAGGLLAFNQHEKTQNELVKGKDRLEAKIHEINGLLETERNVFRKYAGKDAREYTAFAISARDPAHRLGRANESCVANTANMFDQSLQTFIHAFGAWETNLPQPVATAMRYAWATRMLEEASSSEESTAGYGPWKELGLVLLGTAGILVPYEIWNSKYEQAQMPEAERK